MITLAPGIAAPEGSATSPRSAPVVFCANELRTDTTNTKSMSTDGRYFSSFIFLRQIFKTVDIKSSRLLRALSTGRATQAPGRQHPGLTTVGDLQDRFHSTQKSDGSSAARGRSLCRNNQDRIPFVEVRERNCWQAIQHLLKVASAGRAPCGVHPAGANASVHVSSRLRAI